MYDRTRMQLAHGVLMGEKDAHRVLADLLEETGEPNLAKWARTNKVGVNRKLDFAIAMIPYRFALCLGCDFLAAATAQYTVANSVNPTLKRVREWALQTHFEFEDAPKRVDCNLLADIGAETGVRNFTLESKDAADCVALFEAAVKSAERAFKAERESDFSTQQIAAKETVDHVRRVRRWIHEYRRAMEVFGPNEQRAVQEIWWVLSDRNEADFNPNIMEFHHWEIQHAQRWIAKMLESSDLEV